MQEINDLYNFLMPALRSKVNDLKREYIDYIKEADLWNYLRKEMWSKKDKLQLCDMVNDIFNLDKELLKIYYK